MRNAVMLGVALAALLTGCPGSKKAATPVPATGIAALGSGAVTKPSGLRYEDRVVGTGAVAVPLDKVVVNYHGRLVDGTVFDTTWKEGAKPFHFQLGLSQVIKGWDEGVAGMRVGTVRRLVIPPELGYGEGGSPPKIPGNATLVFDVELLAIE